MTYYNYKKKLESQRDNYCLYIPFCTEQQQMLLACEINNIQYVIDKINEMSIFEQKRNVCFKTIEIESVCNHFQT